MADPKYGSSTAGFADAIARMGAQETALKELEKKVGEVEGAEARAGTTTRGNVAARVSAADAIKAQTAALSELSSVLARENTLLTANTGIWRANAAAREGAGAAGGAAAVGGAPAAGGRYGATTVGFSEAIAATKAQSAAISELDAKTAKLVGTQLTAQRALESGRSVGGGLPPSLYREPQLALPPGQQKFLPPVLQSQARPGYYLGNPEARALRENQPFFGTKGQLQQNPTRLSSLETAPGSGVYDATKIGEYSAAEKDAIQVNQKVRDSILGIGAAQRDANAAFNLSVAEYAASSNALQRHGALSTEFIQGLVRGEVTLAEFGSALTSTIGKFAGWAVAGGLVYGAFEALKRVTEGATATASGVAQLERAGIPNFNRGQAEEGFRSVGQRLNVPIGQVAEAQFYAARAGFKTQPESLKAGETALLAEKLDQVPIQDAAKSLGALRVAFNLNATEIRGVFNELDVGQLKFNARLNQTLPQMGRAASAFANAGGNAQELARQLVQVTGATGGGGGQGGGNPATLFIREPSNLAKPGSISVLRQYGFNPEEALSNVGRFNEQLQRRAGLKEGQPGYLSDNAIRELGKAIGGGGALGGRYGIALIESGRTGRAGEVNAGLANAGAASEEDLKHKLAQFNEQFASLGHTFERVGSELGRSGVTRVAEDFITVLRLVSEGFEKALKPLEAVGNLIAKIPAPLQDALVLGAVGLGAQRFARSEKGIGLTRAAGELTGSGYLDSENRKTIQALQRTTRTGLEFTEDRVRQARGQSLAAAADREAAIDRQARFAASPEGQASAALLPTDFSDRANELRAQTASYEVNTQGAIARATAAQQGVLDAAQLEYNQRQKLADVTDRNKSVKQRLAGAAEEDLVLARGGKPGVPLTGAYGPVGAAAAVQARNGLSAAAVAGAAATTEGFDRASLNVREGGVVVEDTLKVASVQIKEGVALVVESLTAGAAGIAGASAVASGVGAGAKGAFEGTLLGAGALAPKIGSSLLKGFFLATIGSVIAEIGGSAVGSVLGKGAGSAVGGIGSDVAIGLGLGTLIPGVGPLLGGAVGGAYGVGKQAFGTAGGLALGGAATGAVVGSVVPGLGTLVGAGIGGAIGLGAGLLFGGGGGGGPSQTAAARARKERAELAGYKENYGEHLESVAEEYGQELETAFKDEGEAAQKAKGQIEKHLRVVAATLKLFGTDTQRGRTVTDELKASATASIEELLKNPEQLDQSVALVEKQQEVILKQGKDEFDKTLKHASSPAQVLAAQAKLENQNQGLYQSSVPTVEKGFKEKISVAQKEQAATEAELHKLTAEHAGGEEHAGELKRTLDKQRKEVEALKKNLSQFHELAPRIYQTLNELNEEAAEATYKKLGEQQAAPNALKLAQAGANPQARAKAEAEIEGQAERNAKSAFKGKYPQQERKVREEQEAGKVQREQKKATEQLEDVELKGARELAQLPAGAPKSRAAEIQAQTDRARVAVIKKNHDNAFSHKQLVEAEDKLLEADRAREEAITAEATELISVYGQIAQAQEVGNALAQAGSALSTATQLLGLAKSPKEKLQAQLGVVNAQNQLAKAGQERIKQQGELEESRTNDPLAKERIAIQTDRRLLAAAKGPDEKIVAQTTLNNALHSYTAALVSNKEQDIEFHKTLGEISNQTAIEQYQSLLKLHGLTTRERQDVLVKIRALQNELGVGNNQVFNAAPGSIKLPTAIDVRRAISAASGANQIIHSPTENHNQINEFNITVTHAKDVGKVADALDRALHGGVKARLRAAGYRGN